MDRPAGTAPALHRRGLLCPDPHRRHPQRHAAPDRHLPLHRHPGGHRGVELPGPLGGGHGAAHRPDQRARLLHHHRRHHPHRVPVDPRGGVAQALLRARRRPGHRHRPDQRGVAHRQPDHAPRHPAPQRPPVQRRQRPGGADQRQQPDRRGAAALRLRAELPAGPALHHPRHLHPGPLRRQAAADHGRRGPGGHRGQGPEPQRRGAGAAGHPTSSSPPAPPRSGTPSTTSSSTPAPPPSTSSTRFP